MAITNEPSPEVIAQLEQAVAARQKQLRVAPNGHPEAPAPRRPKEATLPRPGDAVARSAASPNGAPTAGNATASYLLVDHFVGGSYGTLWAYDGATWRAATSYQADEAGIEQIAFASNRTDVWWDASDQLTIVRCWKYL